MIRDADIVITDSFHATAFSIIYGKRFIVTQRTEANEMVARINSILHIIGEEDKFLSNESFIKNNNEIALSKYKQHEWQSNLKEKKRESVEYLKRCIERTGYKEVKAK